jgi:hypothetical protein
MTCLAYNASAQKEQFPSLTPTLGIKLKIAVNLLLDSM